ncbi:MAG TPA: response regulator [Armatimonadetes bacterium]|nr:response regulator [Armatimonadota bacterium]
MPATEGLRACLTRQSTYVRDCANTPDTIPMLASAGLGSGVALPLHAGGMLYGLLVTARHQADGFTADEIEFLRRLGEHIALAIRQDTLLWDLQSAYKELQRTQQSALEQERLRILGQMASGIAHDINNALMPITTYAELLAMRVPDLDEHAQRYLRSILMAADDIKKTVGRMRELYRKRDGRDQVRSIHIARLMRDVVDLTRPRWHDLPQQQGITIAIKIETDGAPTYLVAVESELREALTNLIANAVDAMPIGGYITLRARPWSRSLLAIEVCDTGRGMDAETRQHCLDPFFTTKGQSGTGLGLSMVQGIVQGHGGTIEIESQPGKGTTVRLLLPTDRPSAAKRELPSSDCGPSRLLRILCIDDDDRVRTALMDMLEADGHTVTGANGGEAGVQRFRHALLHGKPFDIVLTDLGMPHIDGRMVALAIKTESPETPVVLLTGWGTFMEPGVFPEGIDAILGKPPELASVRKVFMKLTQR